MAADRQAHTAQTTHAAQPTRQLLLAGLLSSLAGAALAADGVTIAPGQEQLVRPHMRAAQVEQAIGLPYRISRHGAARGPVWSYAIDRGPRAAVVWFEVHFDASGAVSSVEERAQ